MIFSCICLGRLTRIKLDDILKSPSETMIFGDLVLTLPAESFGLPIIERLDAVSGSYEAITGSRDDCLRRYVLIPV